MSTNRLSHLKDWEKIYLEVTREKSIRDDDNSLCFGSNCNYSIWANDNDTFYTLDELKQLANDGMPKQGEMIEVIQRIPTPYKAWDKVLVLSNHQKNVAEMQDMVWNVCEIESNNGTLYAVWNNKKDNFYYFPSHCLSPAFEEDSLSGKEAKVIIDGKEYSVTLKLI